MWVSRPDATADGETDGGTQAVLRKIKSQQRAQTERRALFAIRVRSCVLLRAYGH